MTAPYKVRTIDYRTLWITTKNTVATTIKTFEGEQIGRLIFVYFGDSNTTIDFTGTNLKGNGGADWSPSEGDWMVCRFDGTNWLCDISDISVVPGSGGGWTDDGAVVRLTTIGDKVGVGTVTVPHAGIGWAKLALEGVKESANGPHVQFTLSDATDPDYPTLSILNYDRGNIHAGFDSYYQSGWKSSDPGSNCLISKVSDEFRIRYDSGVAAGSAIGWTSGFSMNLTTGHVGIGVTPLTRFHAFLPSTDSSTTAAFAMDVGASGSYHTDKIEGLLLRQYINTSGDGGTVRHSLNVQQYGHADNTTALGGVFSIVDQEATGAATSNTAFWGIARTEGHTGSTVWGIAVEAWDKISSSAVNATLVGMESLVYTYASGTVSYGVDIISDGDYNGQRGVRIRSGTHDVSYVSWNYCLELETTTTPILFKEYDGSGSPESSANWASVCRLVHDNSTLRFDYAITGNQAFTTYSALLGLNYAGGSEARVAIDIATGQAAHPIEHTTGGAKLTTAGVWTDKVSTYAQKQDITLLDTSDFINKIRNLNLFKYRVKKEAARHPKARFHNGYILDDKSTPEELIERCKPDSGEITGLSSQKGIAFLAGVCKELVKKVDKLELKQ